MLTAYVLSKPFKPYLDLWMNYRKEHGIESEWLFPKKVSGEYIDKPMSAKTLNSWAETFSRILGVDFISTAYVISLQPLALEVVFQTTLFKC